MNISKSIKSATDILKSFGRFMQKHKPDTKIFVGIAGNAYAMYLTYKKAPEIKEGLEKKDYIQVAKAVAAPIAAKVCSDGMTISAVKDFHNDINAAQAIAASADMLNSVRVAAENEVLAKGKVQEIDHQIAKDISDKIDEKKYPIIETGLGNTLIYDPVSQRLFRADIAKLYDIFKGCVSDPVMCGERIFVYEFWSEVPKIPIIAYEHFIGFDIQAGVPGMKIEAVDRGPEAEKMHVMIWKNLAYFLDDSFARIDRRYLENDANNTFWS